MGITKRLRQFNSNFDEFILEAIKPVAILSMILGTVAVFNRQGLAINPLFVLAWAIVQACSIDGLFFAAWERLFSVERRWKNIFSILGLGLIGLILSVVAIAINAILGFQVLYGIADSQVAMIRLGVSPELFTAVRAALAITVFVMMVFVRSLRKAVSSEQASVQSIEQRVQEIIEECEGLLTVQTVEQMLCSPRTDPLQAVPDESVNTEEQHNEQHVQEIPVRCEQEQKTTIQYSVPSEQASVQSIEQRVQEHLFSRPSASCREVGTALGIAPSTANKWMKRVLQEVPA